MSTFPAASASAPIVVTAVAPPPCTSLHPYVLTCLQSLYNPHSSTLSDPSSIEISASIRESYESADAFLTAFQLR